MESRTSFLANDDQRFASGFQEVEVVDEKIWVLGGDGFGTERTRLAQGGSSAERARLAEGGSSAERARLAQGGFSAESARLAQGGFRGQFSKRNPFKRIF